MDIKIRNREEKHEMVIVRTDSKPAWLTDTHPASIIHSAIKGRGEERLAKLFASCVALLVALEEESLVSTLRLMLLALFPEGTSVHVRSIGVYNSFKTLFSPMLR